MNPERFGQLVNFAPEDFAAGNLSASPDNIVTDDGVGDVIGNPKKNTEAVVRNRIRQYARISLAFGREGESTLVTLTRLIVDEGYSMNQLKKGAHLSSEAAVSILDEFALPRAKRGSVECEHLRVSKLREFWQDPVNREVTNALIHTTASDALRSSSSRRFYEENPEAKERFVKRTQVFATAKRAELCLELFGTEDIKVVLEGQISAGLGLLQIAEKFGKTPETISKWIRDLGIGEKPRRSIGKQRSDEYERRKILVSEAKAKGLFQSLTLRERQVLDLLYGEKNTRPTLREVREKTRISNQRVYQLLQSGINRLGKLARGESVRRGRKPAELPFEKMGDNPSETLVSWYQDKGLSTADIGKKLGCSVALVGRLLREIGVDMRRVGSRRGARFENIDLSKFGELPEEVAQVSVSELNFGLANSILLCSGLMRLSIGELSAMSDEELLSLKGVGKGKVNSIRFAIAKFARANKP